LLSPEGVFLAQNAPKIVCRPGSAQPPQLDLRGATSKEQKGKGGARKERERVEGEGSRSGLPPSPYT